MRHLSLGLYTLGLLLIYEIYHPESASFAHATQIFLAGAFASWFLPERFRLHAMFAVSMAGLFILFPARESVELILLSLATIAICRAPIRLAVKSVLLASLAAAVLLGRRHFPDSGFATTVVPAFGAIFMLRTAFYLKAVQRDPSQRGWKEALAFFLVLPNFVLWFFPLIDFKKFNESARAPREQKTIETGLDWIFEGTMQLIVYRVLQVVLHVPLERVNTFGEFFQFLILNLLTYIRISGTFHVVTGLICLFGIQLPRTHIYYLFCESMVELSRRVNSYWRDFMESIVFRPIYDSTRRWSRPAAFTLAVIAVFWASCLLHSYSAFWTRGAFVLRPQDLVFWTGAGALVATEAYLASKWNNPFSSPWARFWVRAGRIAFTQFVLAAFWAIWTCASLTDFAATIILMRWNGPKDFAWVLIFPVLGIAGALFSDWLQSGRTKLRDVLNFACLAVLLIAVSPFVKARMSENQTALAKDILNPDYQVEFEWIARDSSFYEGLKNNGAGKIQDENEKGMDTTTVFEPVEDYRRRRMRPNTDLIFHGKRFRINEWGMVDERSYDLVKKPGVLRIALISASVSLPYGVEQGQEWPRLVEQDLKAKGYTAMEWMNFSTVSASSLFTPYVLEQDVAKFKPDIVIGPGCERDLQMNAFNAATALRTGLKIPYPELLPLFGLKSADEFLARHYFMRPPFTIAFEIFDWAAEKVTRSVREMGAQPVFALLPVKVLASERDRDGIRWDEARMLQKARETGFETYDLTRVLEPYDRKDVTLEDNLRAFNHYSLKGHRLIADEFLKNFEPLVKAWFERHAETKTAAKEKK